MKKIAIFLLCFQIFDLYCQQIYVSALGNDKNNGTKSNPVYSLQTAFDLSKMYKDQKVTINVGSGKYFVEQALILDEKNTRNQSNKIRVVGNARQHPIFYGGKKIIPNSNHNTKYWEIDMSQFSKSDEVPNFITVNGVQRFFSRFPQDNFIKPAKVDYQKTSITIKIPSDLNEILKKYDKESLQKVMLTFYLKWTTLIRYIDNYDYQKSTITFNNIGLPNEYKIVADETLFKVNNISKNLEPGEWYYDKSVIIYNPLPTEKITTVEIIVPTINQFITASGTAQKKIEFIEFENIDFNTVGKGLPRIGYFPYQAAVAVDAAFDFKHCENLKFKNLSVSNSCNYAFWLQEGCANIDILSSKFLNLGAGAIKIGNIKYISDLDAVHHVTIDNNVIRIGGTLYPDAVAVNVINAFSNTISHNDISDFFYTGISAGWVWGYDRSLTENNLIAYNKIFNIGQGHLDDMAGIYTLGISNGTVIRNNVIYNVICKNYGGWGIYTDEGSSNILIENNLAYNCTSSGFHQHYGRNNTIRNNIFAFNGKAELESTRIEDHNSFNFSNNIVIHKNNNFFASNWLNVKQNSNNNIYYSPTGGQNKRLSVENHSSPDDPGLVKKNYYYEIRNYTAVKKINFKIIDFSETGTY